MQVNIQSRGFSLTQPLLLTTENEISAFHRRFPHLSPHIEVRLYSVNGRYHADKACTATAHFGRRRLQVVASDINADMYTAIQRAFEKLTRVARSALLKTARVRIRRAQ